ncbi:MAG: 16S rRNA (cytosine(1402)-N(4))-methyltransferase RsmH [bacterium]
MAYFHQSVLIKEITELLNPKSKDNFIDCTTGGGGHILALLEKTEPKGKVLGLDLDKRALEATRKRVAEAGFSDRLILVEDNFANLKKIVENYKFQPVNGIILDLGLSLAQLADEERGFSFKSHGRLDMRFGRTKLTAYEIVNSWSKDELAEIFANYGEEPQAKKIAELIVEKRKKSPFNSAYDLANLILKVKYYSRRKKIHPATKVFQALRIAVNEELANLEKVLPQAVEILAPGGRLAVISFHSLEDRIIKNFFRAKARSEKPAIKLINKKVIKPSYMEIKENPRARSAKLRVAEKI